LLGYVAALKRKVMKDLMSNGSINTPILFPYQPEQFWQSIRQIIREEVNSIEKQQPSPTAFETPVLLTNHFLRLRKYARCFK